MKVEQILSDLIEIKTFNKSISNKACIDYICEILKQNNVLHKRKMKILLPVLIFIVLKILIQD